MPILPLLKPKKGCLFRSTLSCKHKYSVSCLLNLILIVSTDFVLRSIIISSIIKCISILTSSIPHQKQPHLKQPLTTASVHPIKKYIHSYIFHRSSVFPSSRTTSLCNLASKIQGSRARSDAYEQTRRIFTLPSRKRLKEQPN